MAQYLVLKTGGPIVLKKKIVAPPAKFGTPYRERRPGDKTDTDRDISRRNVLVSNMDGWMHIV